jgi:antitoxin (DNA-binding transcriptional repressor) of toxin-antitoxin stability system
MKLVKISVAQLSKNVSEYLHLASQGTVVEITSHGNKMAELVCPKTESSSLVFSQKGNSNRLIEKNRKLKQVKIKSNLLFDSLLKDRAE